MKTNYISQESIHYVNESKIGLTKREYFAAQALAGMLQIVNSTATDQKDLQFAVHLSVKLADQLVERLSDNP